ncbi:sigma 54-interacting transcriptional regulator [Leeia sp. TBRC 13508]|uniref:Sigma 54-interacting transcriptional regulator n=1 Tax=Leeia speluncae TaxID=2884804 RepID=A0ABS8D960_9NEIS|nr:sigma 54-interacting transcriptional regulator [Leeia speluncae]MCB6184754.1 sigma 54-interacting transcriptional regulator [Leeia speluncae]
MPSRKPRIAIIAYRRLAALARSVLSDYSGYLDVQVLDMPAEAAFHELSLRSSTSLPPDVLIAASANARWLKANTNYPVSIIKVTGFDLLLAIQQAQQLALTNGATILLLAKHALVSVFESFRGLLSIPVEVVEFQDNAEALSILADYRQRQKKYVVVGSSIVADWAEQQGLPAVIIYSIDALKRAIDEGIALAKVTTDQEEKRGQLNQIVKGLSEGVIAVDAHECIQTINDAAANLFNSSSDRLFGRKLSDVQPLLSLAEVLQSGESQLDLVVSVGQRRLITHRTPMIEHGQQRGALLTFQEASRIEQADRTLRHQVSRKQFSAKYQLEDIVGGSPQIQHSKELATLYAPSDASVLILGESGTGKELFAQGIHLKSQRKSSPFVAVNCAAFPETLLESELFGYEEGAFTGSRKGGKAGLIELAHKGTIFLDEIGDMPLALQTRLLRVLQEKEVLRLGASEPIYVDVRVIAATHANLLEKVKAQTFRADLFYRLNILSLHLSPLRMRAGDIRQLISHFVVQFMRRSAVYIDPNELSKVFWSLAEHYHWPGNVRELENLIERTVVYVTALGKIDYAAMADILPELRIEKSTITPEKVDSTTSLEDALQQTGGDLQATAALLGISRTTLWRKLKLRDVGR